MLRSTVVSKYWAVVGCVLTPWLLGMVVEGQTAMEQRLSGLESRGVR